MRKFVIVMAWFLSLFNGAAGVIDLLHGRTASGLVHLFIGLILIWQLSTYKSLKWSGD